MNKNATLLKALDVLGLALVEHGHTWKKEERRLYERAVSLLARTNRTVTG